MLNLENQKTNILISTLLIILLSKLLLDNIFYFINLTHLFENAINFIILAFQSILFYFILKQTNFDLNLYLKFFKKELNSNLNSNSKFLINIKLLKYALLSLYLIMLIIPDIYNSVYINNNFYARLIISFLAPIFILPIVYNVIIFYRRAKQKPEILNKFLLIFLSIFLFHIIKLIDSSLFNITTWIISVISVVISTFVFFMSIFLFNNNHWIAYLSKKDKYSILINSFLIIIFSTHITFNTDSFISDYSSSVSFTYDYYLSGLSSVVNLISFSTTIIFIRFFITTIIYLPSSDAFERRQKEMVSLTNLNKIISESKDINHITKEVMDIAVKMTSSIFAWSEIYKNDEIQVTNIKNTTKDFIYQVLIHDDFSKFRMKINNLHIDERFNNSKYSKSLSFIKAIIYIPIIDNNEKIGGICLVNNNKYNFDEDELEILNAFSINISIAFENVRLLKESIENEKYKNELQIAKNIQQNLLPRELIKSDNLEVDAFSIPADDVGGDYYDSVRLANGDICYLIGDVSGKGIGAAIFMAQIKGMVMSISNTSNSGKELLSKINSTLYGNIEKNLFVTISAITISNKTNYISYCRAGHTPLAIKRKNSKTEFLQPNGIGIGIVNQNMFDRVLEEIEILRDDIEVLFTFSDGLNELRNDENKEFGYENIRFILDNYSYNNPKELNETFLEKARLFSNNLNQFDDLTLLTICKI